MYDEGKTKDQLIKELKELRQQNAKLKTLQNKDNQTEEDLPRLATFPELDPNPVMEVDFEGSVYYLNPAAQKLSCLKDICYQHPFLEDLQSIMDKLLMEGKDYLIRELRLNNEWYEQTIHYVKKSNHIRIYARDITGRKEAEKEKEYNNMLERFNRELEILVAERTMSLMAMKLADSIRNPVAIIGWNSNKLLENGNMPEILKINLKTIVEEAKKLEVTVSDFQANIKTRKTVFKYESLNDIVRNTLLVIEREAADKQVEMVVNLSKGPLRINAQKDLLRMAVFNMVRNAVELTPYGGRVTVNTSGSFNEVILSVSDTGPDIPKEAIEKIFDPSYSSKIYRFGMGMPLIKQIVSEHLGEIEVDSELGRGTTFKRLFPVRWMKKSLP